MASVLRSRRSNNLFEFYEEIPSVSYIFFIRNSVLLTLARVPLQCRLAMAWILLSSWNERTRQIPNLAQALRRNSQWISQVCRKKAPAYYRQPVWVCKHRRRLVCCVAREIAMIDEPMGSSEWIGGMFLGRLTTTTSDVLAHARGYLVDLPDRKRKRNLLRNASRTIAENRWTNWAPLIELIHILAGWLARSLARLCSSRNRPIHHSSRATTTMASYRGFIFSARWRGAAMQTPPKCQCLRRRMTKERTSKKFLRSA